MHKTPAYLTRRVRGGCIPRAIRPRPLANRWVLLAGLFLVAVPFPFGLPGANGQQPTQTDDNPAASTDYFEQYIRPILVTKCYECHSQAAGEVAGGLWLDSADAMGEGGDSGPAVVAGDIDASILISAIRYESSEMPPDGKLSPETIARFEAWVKAGAVDPRKRNDGGKDAPPGRGPENPGQGNSPKHQPIDWKSARDFWAFRPVRAVSPPQRSETDTPIDAFLNQALEDAGVEAVAPADPSILLRRLAFDLTGLPPTPAQQRAFEADPSETNYRRCVDRLLASTEFAEHWARHWMDVVRYADSNGSDFNATFHHAWRYRNYLIDSFAADRPFDEFVRQQIAGDLLARDLMARDLMAPNTPTAHDTGTARDTGTAQDKRAAQDSIVATTFLMLGTKMLSERDKVKLRMDVVDEQIDSLGRSLMGMTLGCARCHDHKFDPIPTKDYYALAGIFRSTQSLDGEIQQFVSDWTELELPVDPRRVAEHRSYQETLRELDQRIQAAEQKWKSLSQQNEFNLGRFGIDDADAIKTGNWVESKYSKDFIGSGYLHDNNGANGPLKVRFETRLPKAGRYEIRLAAAPGGNRASKVKLRIETGGKSVAQTLDQRRVPGGGIWHSLGTFACHAGIVAVEISNADADGYVIADAVKWVPVDDKSTPADGHSTGSGDASIAKRAKEAWEGLKRERQRWVASAPPPLPKAMVPRDRPSHEIADSPVHIRGEAHNLGPIVPRGFLQVCGGQTRVADRQGSGRLELAAWLTDPQHPLLARVYVNRVWMHLLGEGIVRTVDNFGIRGQRPDHPELLDFLAGEFVRQGWQTKRLIRQIVLSDAYRRSSRYDSHGDAADPENRLLWRAHRKRLPAESIRESMMVAAGRLDRTPIGHTMDDFGTLVSKNNDGESIRTEIADRPLRTIYLPVIRNYVSPLLRQLDFADPDLIVGKRPTTNVPAQALTLMNSPVVEAFAQSAAERMLRENARMLQQDERMLRQDEQLLQHDAAFERRVDRSIRATLHRAANPHDQALAADFFAGSNNDVDRWQQWFAALFATTEFRFLD
ncbi:MAG: DUF1553 domain-containing protein [Planctomycetota bacterium]